MASIKLMERVKTLIQGTVSDDLLKEIVKQAETKVLARLYPFNDTEVVIPPRYENKVIELSLVLYNRLGAEGSESYDDGYIKISYQKEDELLKSIIPYCGVI